MWAHWQIAYAASNGALTAIVFYFAGAAHARPHSKPICRSNRRHPPRLPLSAILAVRRSLKNAGTGARTRAASIVRGCCTLPAVAAPARAAGRDDGSALLPNPSGLSFARRGAAVAWSVYGAAATAIAAAGRMHAWAVRPCAIRRVADSSASTGARCMLYVVCCMPGVRQQCLALVSSASCDSCRVS
jgi:hypothetical protein